MSGRDYTKDLLDASRSGNAAAVKELIYAKVSVNSRDTVCCVTETRERFDWTSSYLTVMVVVVGWLGGWVVVVTVSTNGFAYCCIQWPVEYRQEVDSIER
jgi:hypothetical protein